MGTSGSMVKLLDSLELEISAGDLKNEITSGWSIYQHIEHVLLVNAQIMDLIEKNEEPSAIKSRTIIGYILTAIKLSNSP